MAAKDIDRLIEMGLNRYGAGDLDDALFLWEEALAIDPNNEQASSYVDYVRRNYELLGGEPSVEEPEQAPHAIEEEPEYQIEIEVQAEAAAPAEPAPSTEETAPLPATAEPVDDGWFADAEAGDSSDAPEPEPGSQTLEMEADEPPGPLPPSLNFDAGATNEFYGDVQRTSEPLVPKLDEALDYTTSGPTTGFFRDDDDQTLYKGALAEPAADDGGFGNLETGIRKRDFGFVKPSGPPISIGKAPTEDPVGFDETEERGPFRGAIPDDGAPEPSTDELLASLPTPRPVVNEPESGEIRLGSAPTKDLSPEALRVAGAASAAPVAPILSAPTRELGLRAAAKLSPPDDDDAPTGQSDVRAIRAAAARQDVVARAPVVSEGTSHDIVLPFDPIAAASAQILDELDTDAPQGESGDDYVRRRITRLIEKAQDWAEAGELDKTVTALDLALSEDANSAIAQKLITRNKDTIMQLFQAFLGDLDRAPQLAKPLHELANAPISPRAAFLMSRIDGMLTIDELLDVSGMPRLEAYRHLCQLFLRQILQ